MTIEIKTATLSTIRNTYEHTRRRFGDKPASRYQEASYDIAPENNFHYRPLWEPEKFLNDKTRTAIVMEDWYVYKDPRQFYYGTYVQARAKLQEVAEANYSFFAKRKLADGLSDEIKEHVTRCLLPLRHMELAANMNNLSGCAYGTATVLTQAFLYNGMDRLGIAQYLSRIGLLLDGNSGASLATAKDYWMTDPVWQGVRRYAENSLVVRDWFELFVAQNVVMDTLVYDLFYRQYDKKLSAEGGADIAMLTEFMQEWYRDSCRWVDSVLKTTAAESDANRELLVQWVDAYREKAAVDLAPVAEIAAGEDAMAEALAALDKRLQKSGVISRAAAA